MGSANMSEANIRGSCLCGTVIFEVSPPFQRMIHCHCSRCRKGTGTGHATNLIAKPDRLRWLRGEINISRYDLPTATSFGKWFCSQCGSPLPRVTRSGKSIIIPAGSLDTALPLRPSDHIYWASRASWSCPSSGLPTHAEIPATW
jgi:hypothetical protein